MSVFTAKCYYIERLEIQYIRMYKLLSIQAPLRSCNYIEHTSVYTHRPRCAIPGFWTIRSSLSILRRSRASGSAHGRASLWLRLRIYFGICSCGETVKNGEKYLSIACLANHSHSSRRLAAGSDHCARLCA